MATARAGCGCGARVTWCGAEHDRLPWWARRIVHQIYPRSFQDSDADGIGDLPGIMQQAGYLAWLGVDAVWLSPIDPSPMPRFRP